MLRPRRRTWRSCGRGEREVEYVEAGVEGGGGSAREALEGASAAVLLAAGHSSCLASWRRHLEPRREPEGRPKSDRDDEGR